MTLSHQYLSQRYTGVCEQILTAAEQVGALAPTLVAVSKGRSVEEIRNLIALGQADFGENYVNEGIQKINAIDDLKLGTPVTWHFIGALQSNKTQGVAEHFDWVHTVNRLKIAARLSMQRPVDLPPLNLCIQVNVDRSEQKSGVLPEIEVIRALGCEMNDLKQIRWRGLMCIPDRSTDEKTVQNFISMRKLFEELKKEFVHLDVLSMGMSRDYCMAIQEGATHIRVGTQIFEPLGEQN